MSKTYSSITTKPSTPVVIVTHDLCDKTTWWQYSKKVEHEILELKDGLWHSTNKFWIDLSHKKVANEGRITGSENELATNHLDHSRFEWSTIEQPRGYLIPIIETEASPENWEPATDYTIDYEAGTIQSTHTSLRASYHHAYSSQFDITASTGKVLNIGKVETTSSSIDFNSAVAVLSIYKGNVEVDKRRYTGLKDYLSASSGPPEIYTLCGDEYIELDWDFRCSEAQGNISLIRLQYSEEMRISIRTEDNKPFTGSWCVVSLHCTSETEEPSD